MPYLMPLSRGNHLRQVGIVGNRFAAIAIDIAPATGRREREGDLMDTNSSPSRWLMVALMKRSRYGAVNVSFTKTLFKLGTT
ncbi:hypothetical protein HHL24_35380 [Paraburkholderia sp. RP-4-7]|uniref:Uncharacterized protein n=1 Tax=Paraburkholderia polaris TaxID=2728848 RepID=A0A848ITM1_9BURK|nr:hypothetical protein [Paraburkholderia polaris]NMM03174.1 hypothetical protein [Paraburkholderia polaris]